MLGLSAQAIQCDQKRRTCTGSRRTLRRDGFPVSSINLATTNASIDLAELTDHIQRIQHRLINLAEAKTYAQAPHAA